MTISGFYAPLGSGRFFCLTHAPTYLIWALLKWFGEQGRSFIHGQVTTDISSLADNQWRWGRTL